MISVLIVSRLQGYGLLFLLLNKTKFNNLITAVMLQFFNKSKDEKENSKRRI
jgi:hypothetical protein